MLDEVVDSGDQVFDAPEATSADRLLGYESEPTLHLIEPGRAGGSVVDLEAGPLCQPKPYFCMLAGGVIVDDQMNIEFFRYGVIDALEELKELLMAMTCLALRQDSAGGDVERGEQGGGAMANVVVGGSFDISQSHGQHRLSAVEGLYLDLFIDREHDRMVRRVQVETHDITDFLNEERITGQLEVLGAMRLNGKRLEDAMDSRLRESIRIGGLTNTPVAACWRLVLQSAAEQQSYLLIGYRAWPAGRSSS